MDTQSAGTSAPVGLADRYAAALFELGRERNIVPAIGQSLDTLASALD